jgi:hypothetical protein
MWNGGKRSQRSGDLDAISTAGIAGMRSEIRSLPLRRPTWHRICFLKPDSAKMFEREGATMKKEDPIVDAEIYLQPTGVGGQLVPPADGALFMPDDKPAPDDRGVNEADVVDDDDGLLDAGESPEFDHSLRNRKPPVK